MRTGTHSMVLYLYGLLEDVSQDVPCPVHTVGPSFCHRSTSTILFNIPHSSLQCMSNGRTAASFHRPDLSKSESMLSIIATADRSLAGIKNAAGDVVHGISDSTAPKANSPLPLMSLSSSLAQGTHRTSTHPARLRQSSFLLEGFRFNHHEA
jgi:hypothetical protein